MSDDLDRDLIDRWLRHLPPDHVLTRVLVVIAYERKQGRRGGRSRRTKEPDRP